MKPILNSTELDKNYSDFHTMKIILIHGRNRRGCYNKKNPSN